MQGGDSLWKKIVAGIVVAVVVGLVVNGTAPWWVKLVAPDSGTGSQSTVGPISPGGGGIHPAPSIVVQASIPLTGCVITITNPFVTLHERADIQSEEIGDVPTGQYQTADSTVVEFAGQDQRWFEIAAKGRTGWVQYNTILIDSKSADCP